MRRGEGKFAFWEGGGRVGGRGGFVGSCGDFVELGVGQKPEVDSEQLESKSLQPSMPLIAGLSVRGSVIRMRCRSNTREIDDERLTC